MGLCDPSSSISTRWLKAERGLRGSSQYSHPGTRDGNKKSRHSALAPTVETPVRLDLAGLHCCFDLQALHISRNRCDRKSASAALIRHCAIPAV